MFRLMSRSSSSLRKALTAVAGMAILMTAAGCSSGSSAKSGTVRVTVTPGIGSLPFRVAEEKGFFANHDLKVKVTEGFDFEDYIAGLDSRFDAVMLTPQTTLSAVTAGRPLKGYGGMEALNDSIRNQPLITNKAGIDSLADLARRKGTLGVLRPADTLVAQLKFALKGTGAKATDIRLVAVPFTDQIDQLRAGKIDAAISAAGFYEPLLKQGFRVLANFPQAALVNADAKLPLSYAHFVSTPQYVSKHADTVQKFQTAVEEAETWISHHRGEALKIFAKWVGRDVSSVQSSTIPPWKASVSAADFDPWVTMMKGSGLIKNPVDTSKLAVTGLH